MKRFEFYFGLIKIPLDLLMMIAGFLTVYHLRASESILRFLPEVEAASFYIQDNLILEFILPMALSWLLVFGLARLYTFKQYESFLEEFKSLFLISLFWISLVITYFFLIRDFPFSRFVFLGGTLISFTYIVIVRACLSWLKVHLVYKGFGVDKVLIVVGNEKLFKRIRQTLQEDYRYKIVGYVSQRKITNIRLKYFGQLKGLESVFMDYKFDTVLQIGDVANDVLNYSLVDLCHFYQKRYQLFPEIFNVQKHRFILTHMGGLPIFKIYPTPLDGWSVVLKRSIDIVASFLALIVLSPVFLTIAALIKLDSKGPILFKYDKEGNIVWRVGYKGEKFYCYKFRTMRDGTHEQRYGKLKEQNFRKDSPLVKIKDDPRITRLGHFLRRFDLDELPQLINVLKGEMSLVGPRPHLTEEVNRYKQHHKFVLTIKPGITGLAQVNGRSDLDFEDEVRLDTFYVENWSLWLDIKILLKTIHVVLIGHGEFKK